MIFKLLGQDGTWMSIPAAAGLDDNQQPSMHEEVEPIEIEVMIGMSQLPIMIGSHSFNK